MIYKRKTKISKTQKPKIKNKNNKIHVALLYGGMSAERPVSLLSFKGFNEALLDLGYTVTPVDAGEDLINVIKKLKPDVIFNGLYGTFGEDGYIPSLLEDAGFKYTHSGVLASQIGFDKVKSSKLFKDRGLRLADQKIISKSHNIKGDPMKRPYVIKPACEGSSLGVHVIFDEDNFDFNNYDWKYGDDIIVERYIPGKELNVAVFGDKAIGIMEIIPLKRRFYDYDTKYKEGFAKHIVPADINKEIEKHVLELSERAHNALGCKTLSRVEFRYNPEEAKEGVYILEVNTHPGMTPTSIIPEICAHCGITYQDILERLVKDALS